MNGMNISMTNEPRHPVGRAAVDVVVEDRRKSVEEGVSLRGPAGQKLGVVPWALVAPYLDEDRRREDAGSNARPARPTTSTGVEVRYWTSDGQEHGGVARRLEASTMYLEGRSLLPAGTAVEVGSGGLDTAGHEGRARGVVMWVCPKTDQYGFAPGMAVWVSVMPERFREIFDGPAL